MSGVGDVPANVVVERDIVFAPTFRIHQGPNLRDGYEFAQHELATCDLDGEMIARIARFADGNFLVLATLCRAVEQRTHLGDVAEYLAALTGSPLLDSLYRDEWNSLLNGRTESDESTLRDIVGLLSPRPSR